jgi:hypothetical protein
VAIETGDRSRDEVMKEYEAILRAYPDIAAQRGFAGVAGLRDRRAVVRRQFDGGSSI